MSRFFSIPDFGSSIESMGIALRVMKTNIEILTGQRNLVGVGTPQLFVQATEPNRLSQTTRKVGDLWIKSSDNTMYYWTGKIWQKVVL